MRIYRQERHVIGNRRAFLNLLRRRRHQIAYMFLATATAFALSISANQASTACRQVNRIQGAVLAILIRQQQVLPSNPFFKIHPEALPAARQQVQYDIDLVSGAECKP